MLGQHDESYRKWEPFAQKQMRDRILARMGVTIGEYEDYLSTEEYEQWRQWQKIIGCIETENIRDARWYLKYYRRCEEKNVVEAQYCAAMELMLLQLEDALVTRQAAVARYAVELTMPHVWDVLPENILLSVQELNLLTEYARLCEYQGALEKEFEWRCRQYEGILHYIERSRLDKSCRVMVYPKTAYYLCETILQKSGTEENIKTGINVCHQAIELLRDSTKLYSRS